MSVHENKMAAFTELSVESLRFGYSSTPAIEDISFSARPGELIAIVGPNGCGKSTLLKLLIGALAPTSGHIKMDGRPLNNWGRIGIARRMALVPQMAGTEGGGSPFGDGGFTVRQSVMMARYASHVDETPGILKSVGGLGIFAFETAQDEEIARHALWNADVHHLVDRDLDSLSGGERQRVAIARSLTQQTPILLLDEPTSALDLFHQLELIEQLRTLTRAGTLVLLVTHDLNLALTCATRVLLLDRGKLMADAPPAHALIAPLLERVYHVKVQSGGSTLHFQRLS